MIFPYLNISRCKFILNLCYIYIYKYIYKTHIWAWRCRWTKGCGEISVNHTMHQIYTHFSLPGPDVWVRFTLRPLSIAVHSLDWIGLDWIGGFCLVSVSARPDVGSSMFGRGYLVPGCPPWLPILSGVPEHRVSPECTSISMASSAAVPREGHDNPIEAVPLK